jgi:hypothetical protein
VYQQEREDLAWGSENKAKVMTPEERMTIVGVLIVIWFVVFGWWSIWQ